MDTSDNILGRRLASLRKARKIRQVDVAQYLNVSRQAISKYELGTREPDLATLLKLAEYYGVSMDFLLGRKDEDQSSTLDEVTIQRFLSSLEVAENIMARNVKSDAGTNTEVTEAESSAEAKGAESKPESTDARSNIGSTDPGSNAKGIDAGTSTEISDGGSNARAIDSESNIGSTDTKESASDSANL